MPTLAQLKTNLQEYTTYFDETDNIGMLDTFIRQAEERIFYTVQLPNFRRNVTGSFTLGNQYLTLPADFLAPASLAVILSTGEYVYLLNKDVNFIREAFPNPTVTGVPSHYAIFDADADNTSIIVGKTPAAAYATELHYFYKPTSLVDGADDGTTWLSIHAYDALLYGALDESSAYLKRNAGIDNMGDTYGQRFLMALQGLKNLGEARDRKDVYRSGEKRSPE